ncbi:MAG: hypothetical protein JM58_19220 [Peptococcaceae bacterium BICA1-8]|nr:MAG: hypothetical protein JM58_19220 [Peptococcaceae bacterium BICA1-8]
MYRQMDMNQMNHNMPMEMMYNPNMPMMGMGTNMMTDPMMMHMMHMNMVLQDIQNTVHMNHHALMQIMRHLGIC